MSQSGILRVSTGILPPAVPIQFTTNDGIAVPSVGNLDVLGLDSPENNDIGILTRANPNLGDELDIVLSNRIRGTVTTNDGVTPVTLSSIALGGTPATFLFTQTVVAFDVTDNLSSAYVSYRTVRTTGAAATLISDQVAFLAEEDIMSTAIIDNSIVGNTVLLTVIGLAGKTINYKALTTYIQVS